MLPKQKRLSAREVREVLKKGRAVRSGTASARFLSAASAKAAVVVSNKVAKKATERNTLRRTVYRLLPALPKGKHVVLFIQKKDFDFSDVLSLCSKLS
jgi:ribonuclease P protein component